MTQLNDVTLLPQFLAIVVTLNSEIDGDDADYSEENGYNQVSVVTTGESDGLYKTKEDAIKAIKMDFQKNGEDPSIEYFIFDMNSRVYTEIEIKVTMVSLPKD